MSEFDYHSTTTYPTGFRPKKYLKLITPRKEPHLTVGVQGDVHGQVIFVGQDQVAQGSGFRLGEGLGSGERVGARIPGRTARQPVVVEIAIGIRPRARQTGLGAGHLRPQLLQDGVVQDGVVLEAGEPVGSQRCFGRLAEGDVIRPGAGLSPHPIVRMRVRVTVYYFGNNRGITINHGTTLMGLFLEKEKKKKFDALIEISAITRIEHGHEEPIKLVHDAIVLLRVDHNLANHVSNGGGRDPFAGVNTCRTFKDEQKVSTIRESAKN